MARRKKKLVEQVSITGIADKGKAVGRDAEGQVIFVDDVAPGDVVDVLVLRKKKGFMMGIPKQFHKYSKDRVAPFCQHYDLCGGCKWQHISYEAQLRNKQEVVENALLRIGKINVEQILPILPSERTAHYRNKLEFTFSNKRWLTPEELNSNVTNEEDVLGFHRAGAYDKILNIEECHLQYAPSNEIRNTIRAIAIEQNLDFYDIKQESGFLRNVIFRISSTGQIMLIFSLFHESEKKRKKLFDPLLERFPQIDSLYYCINSKKNDFIMDLDMILYHGEDKIEERLGDVKFMVGPKSFFQTNPTQAKRLYDVVVDFCDFKGNENVYDLYTGLGSIALYIADKCKQVVGIEEIESAIDDAKINMELNAIDNAVFYAGDVKDILSEAFAKRHGEPDIVITDPPRAGMHPKVVELLLDLTAPRIVYVSCNPATQARDLNMLKEKYKVIKVQPVDMFPHTHHIESIALLELDIPKK